MGREGVNSANEHDKEKRRTLLYLELVSGFAMDSGVGSSPFSERADRAAASPVAVVDDAAKLAVDAVELQFHVGRWIRGICRRRIGALSLGHRCESSDRGTGRFLSVDAAVVVAADFDGLLAVVDDVEERGHWRCYSSVIRSERSGSQQQQKNCLRC